MMEITEDQLQHKKDTKKDESMEENIHHISKTRDVSSRPEKILMN